MKRAIALASLVSCMFGLPAATASEVADLVTFTSGTPARAAEVNANFNAVKAAVDDNHARITMLENAGDVIGRLMYGDGSAGDLVVSGSVDWRTTGAPTNLNFNNCTIQSGATLMVSGGTAIRCAGTFTNNGTINVEGVARGGFINAPSASAVNAGIYVPQPGDVASVPGMPGYDTDGVYTSINGARGGLATAKTYILANLSRLRMGGGGGSGTSGALGGTGGGLLRILANGALSNAGQIAARGGGGAGGGGGGIVILASRTSIDNAGTISARGGNGDSSGFIYGACGGGGGGIVVLAAPSVVDSGTVDVAGGAAGAVSGPVNFSGSRAGGGGGGSSGGAGGTGANLFNGETSDIATAGGVGYMLTLQQDPLFVVH